MMLSLSPVVCSPAPRLPPSPNLHSIKLSLSIQTPSPQQTTSNSHTQSPPRSILKRKRSEEAESDGFTSPPGIRSGASSSGGGTRDRDRTIRLQIPKKRIIEQEGRPEAMQMDRDQQNETEEDGGDEQPRSPDFEVVTLEPMSAQLSSQQEKDYFTGSPPSKQELERTPRQIAAEEKRIAEAAVQQARIKLQMSQHPRLQHQRGGLSRYGMVPMQGQPPSIRRLGGSAGGFRVSSHPSPVAAIQPPPMMRSMSKRESQMMMRLLEANQERNRMAEDEAQNAREERSMQYAKPTQPSLVAVESAILASPKKVRSVQATHSSPPPQQHSSSADSPRSQRMHTRVEIIHRQQQQDDPDVFSPVSDDESGDDEVGETDEADQDETGEVKEQAEDEEIIVDETQSLDEVEEDEDVEMQDIAEEADQVEPSRLVVDEDVIMLAAAAAEEAALVAPRTPERDQDHVLPLSQSPLLHAPKKKRMESPAVGKVKGSPSKRAGAGTSSTSSSPMVNARSSVRRSLLPEMAEAEAAEEAEMDAEPTITPPTALVIDPSVAAAPIDTTHPNPVQSLLARIQQDAQEAIMVNGRLYVPLPLPATVSTAPAETMKFTTPILQTPVRAATDEAASQRKRLSRTQSASNPHTPAAGMTSSLLRSPPCSQHSPEKLVGTLKQVPCNVAAHSISLLAAPTHQHNPPPPARKSLAFDGLPLVHAPTQPPLDAYVPFEALFGLSTHVAAPTTPTPIASTIPIAVSGRKSTPPSSGRKSTIPAALRGLTDSLSVHEQVMSSRRQRESSVEKPTSAASIPSRARSRSPHKTTVPSIPTSTSGALALSVSPKQSRSSSPQSVRPSTSSDSIASVPSSAAGGPSNSRRGVRVPLELRGLTDSLSVHERGLQERRARKIEAETGESIRSASIFTPSVAPRDPAPARSSSEIHTETNELKTKLVRVPAELRGLTDSLSVQFEAQKPRRSI